MYQKSALEYIAGLAKPSLLGKVRAAAHNYPNWPSRDQTANTKHLLKFSSKNITYEPLEVPGQDPVPRLANKLDRVLFSPGVHFLKDPRTNVYNFDPRLENVMSITEFDFRFIPPYIPAGHDSSLARLAKTHQKRYTGSTSSLTPILTQLHHAISHQRPPQIVNLPKIYKGDFTEFSFFQRAPVSFWLRKNPKTGTYAVNSPKSSSDQILMRLGQAMEVMLTTSCDDFEKCSKLHPENAQYLEASGQQSSTYNYTTSGSFLMRSQLDCYDPRLPGTGMFDLKTRASCAIRQDIDYAQIKDGSDYHILKNNGRYQSFSSEHFDLVRSALFKYSLQARIGRMDGIFVAYHSIRRLFGFEYLPLTEIDSIYHTAQFFTESKASKTGDRITDNDQELCRVASIIADTEFKISVSLLEKIFDYLHHTIPNSKDADLNLTLSCVGPGKLVLFASTDSYASEKSVDLLLAEAPPNTYGFRISLTQTVNGREVPVSEFPTINTESDDWQVKASIRQILPKYVKSSLKKVQQGYITQVLTSDVNTEEILGKDEVQAKLSQLPEATKLQARLRRLDELGAAYAEWDSKRPKKFLDSDL